MVAELEVTARDTGRLSGTDTMARAVGRGGERGARAHEERAKITADADVD